MQHIILKIKPKIVLLYSFGLFLYIVLYFSFSSLPVWNELINHHVITTNIILTTIILFFLLGLFFIPGFFIILNFFNKLPITISFSQENIIFFFPFGKKILPVKNLKKISLEKQVHHYQAEQVRMPTVENEILIVAENNSSFKIGKDMERLFGIKNEELYKSLKKMYF